MHARYRTRIERDSMGEMRVPASSYYGASTQRAVLNFPISDLRLQRSFIRALALIKHAAAEVNRRDGRLQSAIARAIKKAALEVAAGKFDRECVVDVFQTGSGTSTNMNVNEVIANRAIELLGGRRGDRSLVHPNDHVNMGMSSNDAIPTATHVAALMLLSEQLVPALGRLQASLNAKSVQFQKVVKTGRTHLQDATPITLGQEFQGYAGQIENAIERLGYAQVRLAQVALGGTAVGTGVNTTVGFAADVLDVLRGTSGVHVTETRNHFQAQSTMDEVVECSGALRTLAVSLMKIANDIRWLGSGPRAGLGEIQLPEVQPGSSIMPGKVNPVIAESVCMVCAQVIGNDATIAIAGQSGNFELNVMQPVAAFNLLQAIELLAAVCDNFRLQCIDGITDTRKGPESVEQGLALCTALVPAVGYDTAAAISHEASLSGKTIRQVAAERTSLSAAQLDALLDPFAMTAPEPRVAKAKKRSHKASLKSRRRFSSKRRIIGITGGIACGKSAVGSVLQKLGAAVIDTDDLAHELLAAPNATYDAVLETFGSAVLDEAGGPISRAKLGAIVFADPAKRKQLNAIMHGAIVRLMQDRISASKCPVIAVLVPLLFESSLQRHFHEVWAVVVDSSVQKTRLKERNGLTDEEAQARIDAQLPQSVKAENSDVVIDNSGALAELEASVTAAYSSARRLA